MKNPRGKTSYPAMDLEDADPVEAEEEREPRSRSRRSRSGRDRRGGEGERGRGMEEGGFGAEMGGLAEAMGDAMGGAGGPMGGMGGEMGGAGGFGGTAGQRRLDPKYDEGYERTEGAGGGSGEEAALETVPQSSLFIAGTAAVPHTKLLESYKSALLDAAGYQAQRDRPVYTGFEVQRADVTDRSVNQLDEEDWILVGDWAQHNKIALYQWDGFGAEIVPEDYRDPHLTALIPPLLVYDFTRFATHPLIPLESLEEIAAKKQPKRRAQPTMEGPILPGAVDDNTDASETEGSRFDIGAMRGGTGRGGRGAAGRDPKYKLVRFYDFYYGKGKTSPQPGRDYVYRVRIGLEDPNFPRSPMAQPTLRNLSEDVFARVAPKVAEFEATQERDFVLYSDWSDPSPATSLPDTVEVYAGPVEPANVRDWEVADKLIDYVRTPAEGKVVAMQWDFTLATYVPAEMEVAAGAVLNTKQVAEVIDPLTTVIKKTEEREIATDVMVLDLVGGEPLQIDEDEEMTAPGTMLMFDPEGGLSVRDDVDDLRGYRMHTYADQRENPAPSSGRGGDGESDEGGGGGYRGMMERAGGRG